MPNGRDHLKYEHFGNHKYAGHSGTSDCEYGCGCWMGPTMSGSNYAGVDQGGKCPANILLDIDKVPKDFGNKALSQALIVEDFVNARIDHLSSKIYRLQGYEKTVEKSRKSSKVALQAAIEKIEKENLILKSKLGRLREEISRTIIESE